MQEYIVFAACAFIRFVYSIILAIFGYIKNIYQHASILKFKVRVTVHRNKFLYNKTN